MSGASRGLAVLVALFLATVLVAGAAIGPAAATPTDQQFAVQDNETDETTPDIADGVRVTPETYDEEYLEVETVQSDKEFNTSGPFATFALSEPVESARIEQNNADIRVMGDGSAVRVSYADGAAGSSGSLYTAELFFADGSSRTIDLYATNTDVSVEAAEYAEYTGFIDYVTENAESEGFEATPEGAREYVEHKEERADFLDSMFTEYAMMFISLLIAHAQNPISWVVAIGMIAGLSVYFERKHGWILRLQQIVESRGELMREAVRQDYEQRRNAAAKHPLEDVKEIGPNAARYWRELDVETVDDMVELTCKGMLKVDRNGHIEYDEDGNEVFSHHGVDDLADLEPLTIERLRSETWIQPLILEGRLAPSTALSNIESALLVAEKEYNRGNEVREARRTVAELNARIKGERDYEHAESSSNAARPTGLPGRSGNPAGGD